MRFSWRYAINGTLLAGAFLMSGYFTARIKSSYWNPRKQYEYIVQYDRLWAEARKLAQANNERCCASSEVEKILKKRGLNRTSDSFNPTMEELRKVLEIYKR